MSHTGHVIPFDPTLATEAEPAVDHDTELMLAFQRGRNDAFEELIRRNQGKVQAVLFRVLGGTAESEDLAQEVFLRVFRGAPGYVPTAKFTTWLYRITVNVALNTIRSRSRPRPVSLGIDGSAGGADFQREIPDPRQAGPGARLDRRELAAEVAEAIAQLPEKQRIAIVLNKYEGLCYEDVASILKCSTMAVKSLLSRARGNLKDSLTAYLTEGSSPTAIEGAAREKSVQPVVGPKLGPAGRVSRSE